MAVKEITMKEFPKEFRKLIKEFPELAMLATFEACLAYLPVLIEKTPKDTGEMASSWDIVKTDASVIIGNFAPHAPIVIYGARPFKPPLKPLLEWAKRVLKDGSQPPKYSDRVWALAIHTQKKIEEKGIKPNAFFEDGIKEIINLIGDIMNEELGRY